MLKYLKILILFLCSVSCCRAEEYTTTIDFSNKLCFKEYTQNCEYTLIYPNNGTETIISAEWCKSPFSHFVWVENFSLCLNYFYGTESKGHSLNTLTINITLPNNCNIKSVQFNTSGGHIDADTKNKCPSNTKSFNCTFVTDDSKVYGTNIASIRIKSITIKYEL